VNPQHPEAQSESALQAFVSVIVPAAAPLPALLEVAAEPELAELAAAVAAGGAPAAAEGLYDETRDEHDPRAAAALELLRASL
jgi:hypothetical protein